MMKLSMSAILVVASHYCTSTAVALSINTTPKTSSASNNPLPSAILSRRGAVMGGAAAFLGAGLATLPNPAAAAAETESDLSAYSDLSSGIKYLVTKEGKGEKPVRSQQVYTKYTLWSGGFPEDAGSTKIDSISGLVAPFPAVVGVGKIIKGWDLALLDMRLGEVRRLVIPPEAGYGAKAEYDGALPPNSTLYYSLEIVYMNQAPALTPEQLQWMEANPVGEKPEARAQMATVS
mmetsp:Transcript_32106/g.35948  ORF Transcript_32106/g.35948 Transcript_32106/m.35948 type:complete len:234 (+) Transcript_32106:165-866(+)